jgi:hypothetical protein
MIVEEAEAALAEVEQEVEIIMFPRLQASGSER